jgi:2-hydroxychromene-2-carboxylate isomerase
MRLLYALSKYCPDKVIPVSRALFVRHHNQNKDIVSPQSLEETCIAGGLSVEEAKKYVQLINTPEIKDGLKKNTDEAVDRGAFGAPTFFVTAPGETKDQMFFGSDR